MDGLSDLGSIMRLEPATTVLNPVPAADVTGSLELVPRLDGQGYAPGHVAAVRTLVVDTLSAGQIEELADIGGRIAEALDRNG